MICALCNKPIEEKSFHTKVEGWKRPGKGINNQSGSTLDVWINVPGAAHGHCVVALKNGVHTDQLALTDEGTATAVNTHGDGDRRQ